MAKKKATDTQVGGSHYKNYKIQPIVFLQSNKLNHCEANAIKYICRHKEKGGVEDIDKAIHYLKLLKEIEYGSCGQVGMDSGAKAQEPSKQGEKGKGTKVNLP